MLTHIYSNSPPKTLNPKPCFVASAVYSGPGVKMGFSGRDSD